MIYRHTEEQVDEYFNSEELNQSLLKELAYKGIGYVVANKEDLLNKEEEVFYEEKDYFIIGTAADSYVTMGEEYFKNKYFHSELKKKPTDAVIAIVRFVFDLVKAELDEGQEIMPFVYYKEHIYNAANQYGYSMNRKAPTDKQKKESPNWETRTDWHDVDTRWSSMKFASEYWDDIKKAGNKQVLSDNQATLITSIYTSWLTHKNTRDLFKDGIDVDLIYQMPLFFKEMGQRLKGLPDLIRVEHKYKLVKVLDLKSFADFILKFHRTIKRRRYDFQGSFYVTAVKRSLHAISKLIGKDITSYKVVFGIVAESTIRPGVPAKFPLSEEVLMQGMIGKILPTGEKLWGWQEALQEYIKWTELEFSIEKYLDPTNGTIFIDTDFNIEKP